MRHLATRMAAIGLLFGAAPVLWAQDAPGDTPPADTVEDTTVVVEGAEAVETVPAEATEDEATEEAGAVEETDVDVIEGEVDETVEAVEGEVVEADTVPADVEAEPVDTERVEGDATTVMDTIEAVESTPYVERTRPIALEPAEAVDAGEGDIVDIDPTVTVGRGTETPLSELPFSITIVDRDEIRQSAGETVGDRVDGARGVHLQMTNRGAGAPIVRGQVGPGVLITVDGVRYNNPTFRTGPNQYLNLFDPFAFNTIELLRGSRAVAYGSDAVGGVIALEPAPLLYDRGNTMGLTFIGSSPDNGLTLAPHASLSGPATSVDLGLSFGDYGTLRSGGGGEVPGSDYTKLGGYFRLGQLLSPRSEFTFSYYGTQVDDAGRVDRLDSGNFRAYDNSNHLFLGRLGYRGEGLWRSVEGTISLNLLGEDVTRHDCRTAPIEGLLDADGQPVTTRVSTDPFGCVEGDAEALTGIRQNVDESVTLGTSVVVESEATESLDIVWGADAYQTAVHSLANRQRYPSLVREDSRSNFADGSRAMQLGLYASGRYELALSDTMRLLPEVGTRVTHFNAFAPEVDGLGEVTYDFTGLVGSAQTSLLIQDLATVYLSFNQGFRAPNLQETTVLGDTGNTFEIPNADLGPERSNGLELGTRLRTDMIDVDLSGFYLVVSDYIQRRDATYEGQDTVDGAPVRERYNADSATYMGAEVAFETMDVMGFSLIADASWIQGDVESDGETEPARRVPPLRYSGFLRYESLSPFDEGPTAGRVFTQLGVRGAGEQTRLNSGDMSDLRICGSNVAGVLWRDLGEDCVGGEAWTSLDYHVGFEAESVGTFKLELRNLLDTEYRYYGSGFDAPGFGAYFIADLKF